MSVPAFQLGTNVSTTAEIAALALSHGQSKKRNNVIAAVLSGAVPGIIFGLYAPVSWQKWVLGLFIGLIWGNAFEYAYHRWLLHWPRSSYGKGHLLHHMNVGTPEEPEHVTLGASPTAVVAMFVINGIPLLALEWLLHLGLAPGIFLGWTIYFIVLEEVHWRIHLGPPLPKALRVACEYHLSHHDIPGSRYNVFLPLFDLVCGSAISRKTRTD